MDRYHDSPDSASAAGADQVRAEARFPLFMVGAPAARFGESVRSWNANPLNRLQQV
jgi:hypothetical protein